VRVEGDGWEEALELDKAQADDLHACRTPRVKADGLTVADLCNRFLTAKLRKQTSRELGQRAFAEDKETTDLLVAAFGKTRLVTKPLRTGYSRLSSPSAKTPSISNRGASRSEAKGQ
jgi:hypothetical protein